MRKKKVVVKCLVLAMFGMIFLNGCQKDTLQEYIQSFDSDKVVTIHPGISKYIWDSKIDYRSPDLALSQPFLVIDMKDERYLLWFLFMGDRCVAEFVGDETLVSCDPNKEYAQIIPNIIFWRSELETITELYRSNTEISVVTALPDASSIHIFVKDSNEEVIIGTDGNTVTKPDEETFQSIRLLKFKQEKVLG